MLPRVPRRRSAAVIVVWLVVALCLVSSSRVVADLKSRRSGAFRETGAPEGPGSDGTPGSARTISDPAILAALEGRAASDGAAARARPAEVEWLISCQLPNGAIAQTPDGALVIPYFANLAAAVIAEYEPARCVQYMNWYISSMNAPDRWGLSGTIYDYINQNGRLVSQRKYDSADSYASTFLSLVSRYYRLTGDSDFVQANLPSIEAVAGVITALQDEDGLVRVAPNSQTKYLMDNAENYRGLMDWADVAGSLGYDDLSASRRGEAQRIASGIETTLRRPEGDDYAWAYSWYGHRYPKSGRWYPDAVSQVFLISTGIIGPDDPRAVSIWERLNSQFPRWDQGENGDRFPWTEMAVAAVTMRDDARAGRFLDWVSDHFQERQYPWHVLESSNRVKAEIMLQALLEDSAGLPDDPLLSVTAVGPD